VSLSVESMEVDEMALEVVGIDICMTFQLFVCTQQL
jgi:hypothetical protein